MRILTGAGCVALAVLGWPDDAFAQRTANRSGAADIVVEGEVPKDDRVVCRAQQVTGSIMPKRVCRSPRQAAEERERGLAALEATRSMLETEREIRSVRDNALNEPEPKPR